jgi:hypothetical protein
MLICLLSSRFSWPPYVIQDIWASMLEDKEYLSSFFQKNQALMRENYTLATSLLENQEIPYYKGGYVLGGSTYFRA